MHATDPLYLGAAINPEELENPHGYENKVKCKMYIVI